MLNPFCYSNLIFPLKTLAYMLKVSFLSGFTIISNFSSFLNLKSCLTSRSPDTGIQTKWPTQRLLTLKIHIETSKDTSYMSRVPSPWSLCFAFFLLINKNMCTEILRWVLRTGKTLPSFQDASTWINLVPFSAASVSWVWLSFVVGSQNWVWKYRGQRGYRLTLLQFNPLIADYPDSNMSLLIPRPGSLLI